MCWLNLLHSFSPLDRSANHSVNNLDYLTDFDASNTAVLRMQSFDYTVGPLNSLNPPVYYINMKKSIKRNAEMLGKMSARGIHPVRVPAVSSNLFHENTPGIITGIIEADSTNMVDVEIRLPNMRTQSMNEIATTCSHLLAVRKAYDSNKSYALIVEDDADFDYESMWGGLGLKEVIANAPPNWNIIQLYTYFLSDELGITLFNSLARGTIDRVQAWLC
jgi:hypothetical protein